MTLTRPLAACQIQEAVAGFAQRQGTEAVSAMERQESNSFARKNVVFDRPTNSIDLKQWSRRCSVAAGALDERVKVLVEWAGALEPNAPMLIPGFSNVVRAPS